MLPFFVEACTVAKGSLQAVKRDPVFAHKCWVTSPFMLTRENIEIAMEARRLLDRPIEFGQMPVAGASCPVTVAGALVQNTAESLALCAMRLAIDDLPHPITPASAILDMRHGSHRQSGPDLVLHRLAGSEMHAYLFGGRPTTSTAGVSAQTVSPQSLYEKAWMAAFNFALGHRDLGIGCLATSDVGSPVQLVLDYDMGTRLRHVLREVSVDPDHVGLETILDVAPRGSHHLETEHTVRFFREETWLSSLVDHACRWLGSATLPT
jgi:trimethylamine--corrinoid protein Co-methyltransferase